LPAAAGLLGRIHNSDPEQLDVPVGFRRLSAEHREMLEDFPNQDHAARVRDRLRRLARVFPPFDDPPRNPWAPVPRALIGPNIVIKRDGELGAIDWETTTIDDPMLDLGMSVMNMCMVDSGLDDSRLRLFVEGYRKSGRDVEQELLRPGVEYAAVIVAFH